MPRYSRFDAVDMLVDERNAQAKLWSPQHDQAHSNAAWCMLLSSYVGKLNDVVLNGIPEDDPQTRADVVRRLRQIGALAVSAIEQQEVA